MVKQFSRRDFIKACSCAGFGLVLGCSVRNRFDMIIRNGMIFDGTGSPALNADIAIKGNKIAAINDLSAATADFIIDATGMVVSPGFIDIHTHTDIELLVNPYAESKIFQGVTTEVAGNCGYSPFPLSEADFKTLDQGLVEKYGIHASWNNADQFLSTLTQQKISINYATFTGHGNLRSYVVGKNDVAPTSEQLDLMKRLLAESMDQGSFGLSTGLEYAPGSYANTDELIELCREVSRRNGIYATHIRNEDDFVEEAVEEALKICRNAKVSTEISHLKACNPNNWHKEEILLRRIEQASGAGMPIHADRYPYIAYGTGLSIFLPLWSRQGETEEIISRLQDKALLPDIKSYVESHGAKIGGWDRVMISSCFSEKNRIWEGMTIKECAEHIGKKPFEFIREILIEEKNRVDIVGFAMNEENLKKVLSHPLVMIGSDGNAISPTGKLAEGKPHPRYYGTFPRVLGKYCREENLFDLATAIKKMTSMPAEKLGLKKRGYLREGYFADITIFNPETIVDTATFVKPHQLPVGIEYVIVNGKVTIKNGKHTGELAGEILRNSA
ncbi:MAG: D-aminoacylase [candidate division KSB1 bacterium]|nr:D-aminoacylase [candidate division KSB1 bacterium]MDZ7335532.1 D-aminoacylase [candidate division KSB1 bacterium]MDZ7356899.1 D-aminoacylase [candidate division KSB1 bacterium]MDZ7375608.1 D-aminoacylase [candidate division KSB1 bacterium]MDZ7399270.1 D-aminoacylase [candidate division KSB1 bacterium]